MLQIRASLQNRWFKNIYLASLSSCIGNKENKHLTALQCSVFFSCDFILLLRHQAWVCHPCGWRKDGIRLCAEKSLGPYWVKKLSTVPQTGKKNWVIGLRGGGEGGVILSQEEKEVSLGLLCVSDGMQREFQNSCTSPERHDHTAA
jgi:hypothetical protein